MHPRIKAITLIVDDLERSLRFYRDGMGLDAAGITGMQSEDGALAFFYLNDDLILSLWPASSLAKDAGLTPTRERTGAVSIGHVVASKDEVDAIIGQARCAGATIVDPPHDRFWGGYSGYFRDPDGHLWEIAWHPAFRVAA